MTSSCGSKLFFTKCDIDARYWQVELKKENMAKISFQVGNFDECNRMPFGLCNTPATFKRLEENILFTWITFFIFSETLDQHLYSLES